MQQNRKGQQKDNEHKLLDLEKYRLKLKLRDSGIEWHEDHKGKFRIWLRAGKQTRFVPN